MSDLIPEDELALMEAVAKATTPGPWIGPDSFLIGAIPLGRENQHASAYADAQFIAAFDPSTVLTLIAGYRAWREAEARAEKAEAETKQSHRERAGAHDRALHARMDSERIQRELDAQTMRYIEAKERIRSEHQRAFAAEARVRELEAEAARLRSGLEDPRTAVLAFAQLIEHGDEEHRRWLREAARAFVSGGELPPPRSASGAN